MQDSDVKPRRVAEARGDQEEYAGEPQDHRRDQESW